MLDTAFKHPRGVTWVPYRNTYVYKTFSAAPDATNMSPSEVALVELNSTLDGILSDALGWKERQNTRRNYSAHSAAYDNHLRAKEVLNEFRKGRDVKKTADKLQQLCEMAKFLGQAANPNNHDTEYTAAVHNAAAIAYEAAHTQCNKQRGVSDAHVALTLLFSCNGKSKGYREIKCVHTSSTENIKDDSTEVRHDLKVKITAAGELFAIKLGGEIGYEYANLVRQSNSYKVFTSVEQTDILHVDISAPCYVYQLESTAKMTDSSHVTLWGNMFVVNKAIKSRLISGSQDPSQLAHITVQKTSGGHPSTYRGHVRSRHPQPERPQPQMQPERPQLQQHVRQQPSAAQSQLVQCPQCHNHLPVPLGTSDFSCGGCGLEMQMPGTGQQQQQASPAHGQYTTVICPSCHNRLNVPHGTHIFTCGGCGTGMHM
eukprot:gene16565-22795_t